jgi:hypothetical protein
VPRYLSLMRSGALWTAASVFCGLSSSLSLASAQVPDSTGSLVVIVSASDNNAPLAYSSVGIASRGVERLTNDRGVAVLSRLIGGSVDLTVRHLGFSPAHAQTTIRVHETDTVRVALIKLAVQLGAVQVRAARTCTNPGPPSAATDPAFAALFDQLEENAAQYRLLSEQYPFTYEMERKSSIRYVGGDELVQRLDTIHLNTGLHWRYAPGAVVEQTDDPRNRQVVFNIPALVHFADSTFLRNHCFFAGGREMVNGTPAIRIDFLAASRIKAPDVNGSMYLDPVTYQIRRSVLRLTRIPDETPQIESVTVVTEFKEIVPSISIASSISSVHRLFADSTRAMLPLAAYETQRLLRVIFLKDRP